MQKTSRFVEILISAVCVLISLSPTGIHAQSSNYTFTPVVQAGDLPPGQGDYRFSRLGAPLVNNHGDVVFGDFQAVYLSRQGQIHRVAQRGEPSPFGPPNNSVGGFDVNDRGDVLFGVQTPEVRQALLLQTAEGVRTVAATGQEMPTGGRVRFMYSFNQLNNRGEVAFFAALSGGSSSSGVFLRSGEEIRPVVLSGQASPLGGVFQYTFPARVDVNDHGEVVFVGQIAGGRARDGLFLFRDGVIETVMARGDPTPLGGQFDRALSFQMNNDGQVLFHAGLTSAPVGSGVFLWRAGVISKVIATGDATPLGGRFGGLLTPPVLNNQSQVAMAAVVEGGTASAAIFLISGEQIVPVVTVGQATPLGGEYARLGAQLGLTDGGAVIFETSILRGPANQGIFWATPTEATPVVTTNDVVPEGARLTALVGGFAWSKRLALNQQGDVAFVAGVGGGEGIFFASGGLVQSVVRSGQVLENGDQMVTFGRVALNQEGALLFTAERVGGGRGVYQVRDGQIQRIAGPGDPSPLGGTFAFADFAAINDRGQVAFRARVNGGMAEEGIFLADGQEVRPLVTTADVPPVEGRFTHFGGLALNPHGQVAFVGLIQAAGSFFLRRGVFLAADDRIHKIAMTGDPTLSGRRIASFGDEFSSEGTSDVEPLDGPSVNEAGAVGFWTYVIGDTFSEAILVHTREGLREVAVQGQASSLRGPFLTFIPAFPSINDRGEMAFSALVQRGQSSIAGLFVASEAGIQVAARFLQESPTGGTFLDFSPAQLNDAGLLLFEGFLQGGPTPSALFLAQPPRAP